MRRKIVTVMLVTVVLAVSLFAMSLAVLVDRQAAIAELKTRRST